MTKLTRLPLCSTNKKREQVMLKLCVVGNRFSLTSEANSGIEKAHLYFTALRTVCWYSNQQVE